jgi:hypothetical protein
MTVERLERARDILLESFGDRWQAPYAEGKAKMADQVCDALDVPHEAAVGVINDLERSGAIQFVGVAGAKPAPPSSLTGGVPVPTPAAPATDAGGVGPESGPHRLVLGVLGDWIISSRVV